MSAVCLGIASLLGACGGGGTTGPLQRHDDPAPGLATSAYITPDRVTLSATHSGAPAGKVKVGVVDTGFLVDHFELRDQVADAQAFAGTGTLADNAVPHGTQVAMVLAGAHMGHTGNAELLLAKAADTTGFISVNAASSAAQWALAQGARVLNFSIGPMYRHYGAATDALYGQAVLRDAVVVMVAGNEAANLSAQTAGHADIFEPAHAGYRDVSLVVGAVRNNQLASYSSYPGESAAIQSRFLVAEGTHPVQGRDATAPANAETGPTHWFSGTSAAAPVVSAAAATLRAYWPHLSAAATAQLLLDTADRGFTALYGHNHCGSGGNLNCGTYTFGQGKLDLERALLPVGTTSLPAGASLGGASYAVNTTQLVLPAAFGDALAGRQVGAALFDGYGRDFGFNLLQRVAVGGGASLLRGGALEAGTETAPQALPLAFDGGRWTAQLTRTSGTRAAPFDAPLRLASLAGSGPLGRYGAVHGLGLTARLGQGVSLQWRGTHAQGASATANTPSPSALRQDAGLQWRVGQGGRVGVGYALTRERHALLGGTGSAGLGLAGTVQHAAVFEAQYPLAPGLALFGQAERGWLQARGNGLLTRLDAARTSQWAAGVAWARDKGRWGLALSQPVRVERARAHFDLPVGRTLDGGVVRQRETVSLAPGGRQINLELAYQHQADALTQWGFNAVWARDFGHVAGRREWAVMARYGKRW